MSVRISLNISLVRPCLHIPTIISHFSSVNRSLSFLYALLMARDFSLYSGLLTFFPCAFICLLSSIKSSVSSDIHCFFRKRLRDNFSLATFAGVIFIFSQSSFGVISSTIGISSAKRFQESGGKSYGTDTASYRRKAPT